MKREKCTLCPKLSEFAKCNCMKGSGPEDARLMIVGEAPGGVEDEGGRAFIGKVGVFMDLHLFPMTGIKREKCRITNAVRCRPPKNRVPTILEIERCRKYLTEEVERVRPRCILVLGNVPLASALSNWLKIDEEGQKKSTKVGGISRWRGKAIWHSEWNCWVVPSWHPSGIVRTGGAGSPRLIEAVRDWELAQRLSSGTRSMPAAPITTVAKTRSVILGLLNTMTNMKTWAFDVETSGPTVIGWSVSFNGTEGHYVPHQFVDGDSLLMGKLSEALTSNAVRLMHNGNYELLNLPKNKIAISDKYYDTMIAAHQCDENFEKGLKALAWRYTSFGGYHHELMEYRREHGIKSTEYGKIPLSIIARYGALDACATFQVYEKTVAQMKEEKTFPAFSRVFMPMRRVMTDVERTGILFDRGRAEMLVSKCEAAMERIHAEINDKAGEEVNVNATAKLSELLFDKLGFKPLKFTKAGPEGGKFAVDRATLQHIAKKRGGSIAQAILDLKYIDKMMWSFIKRGMKLADKEGRIHVGYNLTGTVTGRASCTIHNIPNDPLLRGLYVARPGCNFVEADLKSAELAYLAAESGEETFLKSFATGADPHVAAYRRMMGWPDDHPVTKEERRIGKTINFGIVYGMSVPGLAARFGTTEAEAEEFIRRYFEGLPKVKKYIDKITKIVTKQGYVTNLFGQRRRLPDALLPDRILVSRAVRQAVNAPIQGGAALCTYVGAYRLWTGIQERDLEARLVHTVHDNVLTETPDAETDTVVELTRESFESKISVVPVKMMVDIAVHKRWGEGNDPILEPILERYGVKIPKERRAA